MHSVSLSYSLYLLYLREHVCCLIVNQSAFPRAIIIQTIQATTRPTPSVSYRSNLNNFPPLSLYLRFLLPNFSLFLPPLRPVCRKLSSRPMSHFRNHVHRLPLRKVTLVQRLRPFAPQLIQEVKLALGGWPRAPALVPRDESVREVLGRVGVAAVDGVGEGRGREELARRRERRFGDARGQGAYLHGTVEAGGRGGRLEAEVGAARAGENIPLGPNMDPGVVGEGTDVFLC